MKRGQGQGWGSFFFSVNEYKPTCTGPQKRQPRASFAAGAASSGVLWPSAKVAGQRRFGLRPRLARQWASGALAFSHAHARQRRFGLRPSGRARRPSGSTSSGVLWPSAKAAGQRRLGLRPCACKAAALWPRTRRSPEVRGVGASRLTSSRKVGLALTSPRGKPRRCTKVLTRFVVALGGAPHGQ